MCSFGDDVATAVSRKLNWELISRKDLFARFPNLAASSYDLNMLAESAKYYLKAGAGGETYLDSLKRSLQDYLRDGSAVLTGFGSQVIFADWEDALHVRIIASKKVRVVRAKKQYRVSDEEAEKILDKADKKHRKFVSTVFGVDLSDPSLYHLILNTSALSVDECTAGVIALHQERERLRQLERQARHSDVQSNLSERPALKNQSEEEFARLLDMYQLDWKYEPKTFPIEWDAEGNVTAAFSPDFYLTNFDTYIELTTMEQKYVTSKNKKVKKVRELYPGTNINIVYKKGFRVAH
jgi:cytidylate kinase